LVRVTRRDDWDHACWHPHGASGQSRRPEAVGPGPPLSPPVDARTGAAPVGPCDEAGRCCHRRGPAQRARAASLAMPAGGAGGHVPSRST
jgi:hypothetical protein